MNIPKEIKSVLEKLKKNGYEAYLVGGCVRDLLRGVSPEDWDISTNARPEDISKIFPESFYENKFGTVTALTGSSDLKLKEVEITPYRIDEKYSDKRHPDKISYAKTIEEDLSRRDFTVNAIALSSDIIDPFEGQKDLKKKVIKAVRDPEERFSEDALRMMRAVRFSATLGFKIEDKTANAILKNSNWISAISKERIRDEFLKIVMSDEPDRGIENLRVLGLLKYILPELEKNYGVGQNKHHIYDCYEHALRSLRYAADKKFNKYVRLAALFHDIAKPIVKRGEGSNATFYGHEIVGAKATNQILQRLRFSKKDIEKVVRLVRYHLFYYNAGEVHEASVRRLVSNVGLENMDELLEVRMADRIGSGVPKAEPYKLRHLKYIIEKVSSDAISVKMIKIKGNDVIDILGIKPGPKIGWILNILLAMVLLDPKKNKKEVLEKEVKKLGKLSDKDLEKMSKKAMGERDKIEMKKDEMTKKKYWVT